MWTVSRLPVLCSVSSPVVLVLKIKPHLAFIHYKDLKELHIKNRATSQQCRTKCCGRGEAGYRTIEAAFFLLFYKCKVLLLNYSFEMSSAQCAIKTKQRANLSNGKVWKGSVYLSFIFANTEVKPKLGLGGKEYFRNMSGRGWCHIDDVYLPEGIRLISLLPFQPPNPPHHPPSLQKKKE